MSDIIKPTIGRVVLYQAEISEGGKTLPALITAVHNDEMIDIVAFSAIEGKTLYKSSIPKGINVGQWDWMPFQKDQQARLANNIGGMGGGQEVFKAKLD